MIDAKEDFQKIISPKVSKKTREKILNQMDNCIFQIYKENIPIGRGFFCKIPYKEYLFPFLVTNYNILNEKDIENNETINIHINKEIKEIKIGNSRKKYSNQEFNVTFIEIKPNRDKINIINFIEIEENLEKIKMKNSI